MRGLLLGVLLVAACGGPADEDGDGFTSEDDCDDTNFDVKPSAAEACDGVDNDCDGLVDDEDADVIDGSTFYADGDGDGYGDADLGSYCEAPASGVAVSGDCDDTDADVHPDATEICNEIDDDCDTLVDADDDSVDTSQLWYRDGDGDGYGSSADFVSGCDIPEGYVAQGEDCDDGDDERNPGAPEICDGKDNNCDVATGLLVDDADPAFVGNSGGQWLDEDGDGVGGATVVEGCDPELIGQLSGSTGDCDDADDTRYPGASEGCDGIDHDCDGTFGDDEWSLDTEAYRIAIDVVGGTADVIAPPIALDVDLNAPLVSGETVAPATLLLAAADCDANFPRVPFDFADRVRTFFADGVAASDKVFEGTLGFRYDTDGVWATQEALPAGATRRYYLYFSSTTRGSAPFAGPVAPAMTYGTPAAPSIDNGLTKLVLDPTKGNLSSYLGLSSSSDNFGAQTSIAAGNGLFLGTPGGAGSWVTGLSDTSPPAPQLLSQGDVMAVWQVSSSPSLSNGNGAFRYTYTWLVFNGRPEVYLKTTFLLTAASYIGDQAGGWTSAVRPFEADLNALGAGEGFSDPGKLWMRSSFASDTKGVFVSWRNPPALLGPPVVVSNGRYVGLSGADYSTGNAQDTAVGRYVPYLTNVVDGSVQMILPYAGAWSSVQDQALALTQGTGASVVATQAR